MAGPRAPPPKPSLRGVWHTHAAVAAAAAGTSMVASVEGRGAALACAAYAASLTALLSISSLYHRPTWSPGARAWMRRLDHAAIFLLIFGTHVPLCLIALPPAPARRLLMRVGAGAAAGVAQSMLIPHNKPLSAAVCVAVGAAIAPDFGMVAAALPPGAGGLIVAGGVAYAVGALTYALRWPNPFPLSFGYHEVFHALVVLAGGLHFAAVHIVAHAVKGKGAGRV